MTKDEIEELIDFENDVLKNTEKAVKLVGGGPIMEMAAKIGMEKHQQVIKALEEYRDLLNVRKLIDG